MPRYIIDIGKIARWILNGIQTKTSEILRVGASTSHGQLKFFIDR